MPTIEIPDSELLDRLSILMVKRTYLKSDAQLKVVQKDIEYLQKISEQLLLNASVQDLYTELLRVNDQMWVAMEHTYQWEGPRNELFEDIILQIIEVNKERAFIKQEIDNLLGSELREAKSFFES